MKKAILLCFVGVAALWAGSAALAGSDGVSGRPLPPVKLLPAHPPADYYRNLCKRRIEARGVLNTLTMPKERRPFPEAYLDYVMIGLDGWIAVNGKHYPLDFGANPELRSRARTLNGKRVILQGRVETRDLPFHPNLGSGYTGTRAVEYVLVTSIEDQNEYVTETVEVDVQGRLDADYLLGFDGTSGPVVHAGGQTYVLEFSNPEKLRHFDAKTVHIRATRGEMRSYIGLMVPKAKAPRYRVLHVLNIELAEETSIKHGKGFEIRGPVHLYRHMRFGRGAIAIEVAGHPYYLDFTAKDALYELAARAARDGKMVRVAGNLRTSDGAVEVSRVEVIEPEQFYRETVMVEIRGFLQMAPQRDDLPDLAVPAPYWMPLQVNVNGRVLTCSFPDNHGLFRQAREMVGKLVTLRGQLQGDTVIVSQIDNG